MDDCRDQQDFRPVGWLKALEGVETAPIGPRAQNERRPVEIDGTQYSSLAHAAKKLKVCRNTVINRIQRGRGRFL